MAKHSMKTAVTIPGKVCLFLIVFVKLCCQVEAVSHNHPKALLPIECCSAMTPVHPYALAPYRNATENVPAQDNKNCPFSVTSNKEAIKPGEFVQLTIQSNSPDEYSFKGYVVMAFDQSNTSGIAIGSFQDPSDGRLINCPRGFFPSNTVTHDDVENKTSVTVKWVSPESFEGNIVFISTYVQNYYQFWVNVSGPDYLTIRNSALALASLWKNILGTLVIILLKNKSFDH